MQVTGTQRADPDFGKKFYAHLQAKAPASSGNGSFTLSPDSIRFDKDGNQIANNPKVEGAGSSAAEEEIARLMEVGLDRGQG